MERPTLARRLVTRFALVVVVVLAVLGVVLDRRIEATLLDDLTDTLVAEATAVARALPSEDSRLQREVRSLGRALHARITVIGIDGTVLADSERDPAGIGSQAEQPEVAKALAGETGVDSRVDEIQGARLRYVAVPPRDGRLVRVAQPLDVVSGPLGRVRLLIASGSAIAAVLGVGAVYLVARRLTRPLGRMTEAVSRMSGGGFEVRVPSDRTAELALLAETINRLAADLERRIGEIEDDRQMREGILAGMEEGVVLVEGDRVQYVNPAARRLLRGVPREVRGLTPHGLHRLVESVGRTGTVAHEELQTGFPVRTVRATSMPVGGRDRVLVVLRDVTQQRRVEAMRRDFVADASHELKTPVAAIRAASETLRAAAAEDPEAAQGFAERLERDAERLSRIVSDLLDLSRLETERPAREAVRLDRLAHEEAERLDDRARQAGVRVRLELEEASLTGDENDLRLLIANLLDNGIRYTGRGGEVRLEVARRDGDAQLIVADTGIGIPSRDLPRIFERFYRVDRARSRGTGGTGLGLSIARHVAERHGGRIEVESELGRGSTFRVVLPLVGQAEEA